MRLHQTRILEKGEREEQLSQQTSLCIKNNTLYVSTIRAVQRCECTERVYNVHNRVNRKRNKYLSKLQTFSFSINSRIFRTKRFD